MWQLLETQNDISCPHLEPFPTKREGLKKIRELKDWAKKSGSTAIWSLYYLGE